MSFADLFFESAEPTTVSISEYKRLQAELEYYKNRVRQLEQRPYLEQVGTGPQGKVLWGTPAHGTEAVRDGQR